MKALLLVLLLLGVLGLRASRTMWIFGVAFSVARVCVCVLEFTVDGQSK